MKKSNARCPDWTNKKKWIKGCCPKDEGKYKSCKSCANFAGDNDEKK